VVTLGPPTVLRPAGVGGRYASRSTYAPVPRALDGFAPKPSGPAAAGWRSASH